MPWTLTVRAGPQVAKEHFDSLDAAVAALETEGRALVTTASGRPLDTKIRRFEPVQLVSARLEISGPQRFLPDVHAGVDVRGDGSVEAFIGRVRKRAVEQRNGEDAYAALRRELQNQRRPVDPQPPLLLAVAGEARLE